MYFKKTAQVQTTEVKYVQIPFPSHWLQHNQEAGEWEEKQCTQEETC